MEMGLKLSVVSELTDEIPKLQIPIVENRCG